MASLSGWIYIIVGVIVSVYSRLIMKQGQQVYVMNLFFYLGVVFFGIGVYKLVIKNWPTGGKKSTTHSDHITVCKSCGTKNYVTSNYCHICGAKVERKAIMRS